MQARLPPDGHRGQGARAARDALDLDDVSGLAKRADEEKEDYPSIRVRPEYIRQPDVATAQDVEIARGADAPQDAAVS
jgi:hypothetical protein